MTTFTTTILLQTLLVLMQLLSAAAANGWNLDMACQPVGEVSKVYYSYDDSYSYGSGEAEQQAVEADVEPVPFILTADWGEVEHDATVQLGGGGAEAQSAGGGGADEYGFEHVFTAPGTYELSFTSQLGLGKVRLSKVCEIAAASEPADVFTPPAAEDETSPVEEAATPEDEPEKAKESSVQAGDTSAAGPFTMLVSSSSNVIAFATTLAAVVGCFMSTSL
jgi:hypothetical protein